MSEKVNIRILASEAIRILECLAFDNFEKNKTLMTKIIIQLNVPLDYRNQIMKRLKYFAQALSEMVGDKG